MRVQRVVMPVTGAESWTVVDDEWALVEPVERYLAHLAGIERSPNTVRAYAHGLRLWFEFLGARRLVWDSVGIEDVSRFVAWLRAPADNVIVFDDTAAVRSAATVNRHLAALFGFYDFHARSGGVGVAAELVALRRGSRGSYKPFLHGIASSGPVRLRPVRLRAPRRLPAVLGAEEIAVIMAACTRLRDRFLFALLAETGMRTAAGSLQLDALNMRLLGLLADPVAATDTTIRLPSVDGLRVGESLQFGTADSDGPNELMRIAGIDVASSTVTVEERYRARGIGRVEYVGPRSWPAQTEVYQHRRARPARLPGYMVDSGVAPSFSRFRLTWEGRDVPYLAMNLHFPGGDDEFENWEELLVYLRLRRADGTGTALEGILPMAVDGSVPFVPAGGGGVPGDPYTLREQRTRRYYGWPETLDQSTRGASYVAYDRWVVRARRFVFEGYNTFQRKMVDWIYSPHGHDLGRIYPWNHRHRDAELAALQQPAAAAGDDLVRSYQVVVDVALLDGTDPRLDIGDFSVTTSEHADETDLGDLAVAGNGNLVTGSVSRLDDPHDHFEFTLSQRREVQLSLSSSDGQAAIMLEDHARPPTGGSDAASTDDESITATLDPGTYRVRVSARSGGTVGYVLRYQASAPTLWSASLTVGVDHSSVPPNYGYSGFGGSLSNDAFALESRQHRVQFLANFVGGIWLGLSRDPGSDFTLRVGDAEYARADSRRAVTAARATYWWDASDASWAEGETIEVAIKAADGTRPQQSQAPPAAFFTSLPRTHDGATRFNFRLTFTENFPLSYKRLKDHSIVVEGGRLVSVKRLTRGSNQRWVVTVQPTSADDIVITMSPVADCTAANAICTSDGRQLHNAVEATIPGRPDPGTKDKLG